MIPAGREGKSMAMKMNLSMMGMDTAGMIPGVEPGDQRPHVLIAGLGNELFKDDGVGVHVARELLKAPPPGVQIAALGTAFRDGLAFFRWADRVVAVDALQAGGPPGTIYGLKAAGLADGGIQASLHEDGLLAALRLLSPEDRPSVSVFGVEPEAMGFGRDLSPALQKALPRVVQRVREIAFAWRLKIGKEIMASILDWDRN